MIDGILSLSSVTNIFLQLVPLMCSDNSPCKWRQFIYSLLCNLQRLSIQNVTRKSLLSYIYERYLRVHLRSSLSKLNLNNTKISITTRDKSIIWINRWCNYFYWNTWLTGTKRRQELWSLPTSTISTWISIIQATGANWTVLKCDLMT